MTQAHVDERVRKYKGRVPRVFVAPSRSQPLESPSEETVSISGQVYEQRGYDIAEVSGFCYFYSRKLATFPHSFF